MRSSCWWLACLFCLCCAPSKAQLLIAHRGASHDAPENTLAAFALAWKQGADGIEADFHLTKDGHLVCLHDADTQRTTKVQHVVAQSTLAELKRLDVGSWKNPKFADQRIPTLAEVLKTIPMGKNFYIELKVGALAVPPLKKALEESNLPLDQIRVISFHPETIAAVRQQIPQVKAYWIVAPRQNEQGQWLPSAQEIVEKLTALDAHGLDLKANLSVWNQDLLQKLRQAGKELHTWTVDDVALAAQLQSMGASSITTNKPALLASKLARRALNDPYQQTAPPQILAEELKKLAQKTLAQLEGELKLPGLKQPVKVWRDRWGIPHIYAENQDDLFFAQGVVVAQDRLFQIDLWRRIGIGELAEVMGPQALEGDRFARLVKFRGDWDAEWNSYSPDAKQIATQFTRGINAYIDHVSDRLQVEFQLLGFRPAKWQPEDCLGRMSGVIMVRNLRYEVPRAWLINAVGAEKAEQLIPTDPVALIPKELIENLRGIDDRILSGYRAATSAKHFGRTPEGSNNWAVDGTLSDSGKPLMASDPHRSLNLPSLRYLVHLHAPGWNVIGGGEPGLPGVALGHNDRIAWGFTIVGTDQADLYIEETNPEDPGMYRVGNEWHAMQEVREWVKVRGTKPVEMKLHFTRHGPVIHQDNSLHRAYALRWVGSEPGAAAYLGSLAVGRANNWKEFRERMATWKMPSENMVYADVDGNIGWVAAALTPVRTRGNGLVPVPGAKGEFEWKRFLNVDELPQLFNPPSHWVGTANHNILPPNYPHEIGYEFSPPYRFQRVKTGLESQPKHNVESFQRIQLDSVSLPGRTLAKLAERLKFDEQTMAEAASRLAKWDGHLSRESTEGGIYAVWLEELLHGYYRSHVPAELLDFTADTRRLPGLLAALLKPTKEWFGEQPVEARDKFLHQTFTSAVQKLKKRPGGDGTRLPWGELHRALFEHPLGALGTAYAEVFNVGPVGRPGDGLTPNATSWGKDFLQTSGASYRHVMDLADWDRATATSTPGQSGQPGSPHYADLLPLWAAGEYFPLAFSQKKVEEVTQHRLLLLPLP